MNKADLGLFLVFAGVVVYLNPHLIIIFAIVFTILSFVGVISLVKASESIKTILMRVIAPEEALDEDETDAVVLNDTSVDVSYSVISEYSNHAVEDVSFNLPKRGDKYCIPFGVVEGTDIELFQNLSHAGHTFILGVTRYGKTVKMHDIIKYLIETHSPDELQIGFSDAKQISYNIYKKLPHCRWPIAGNQEETLWMLQEVKQLMKNRLSMFSQFEDRICENCDDYERLTGKKLPKVVIIFDELADSILKESEAEAILTTIAKMGLASGIHIIMATQRPTREAISHEVQSQCITTMCTYMKKDREYSFSGAPKEVYRDMTATKGRFMSYSPESAPYFLSMFPDYGGWGIVQGKYYSNAQIEQAVVDSCLKYGSKENETWLDWGYAQEDEEIEYEWGRTHFEKIRAISMLGRELGEYPTKEDIASRFGITLPTAQKWLEKTY